MQTTIIKINGLKPVTISVDNYFLERGQTPRDENGDYDFETIEAIDLNLDVYKRQELDIKVVKRNGRKVDFNGAKIAMAIKKGFDSVSPRCV